MTIQTYLKQFENKKIAVLGEMMLDCYFEGTSTRISREAPVPIVDVHNKSESPGGAANTALNVTLLGGRTYFISMGGNDWEGRRIIEILKSKHINTEGVMLDPERLTLAKKRIVSEGQLLLRYDHGNFHSMSPELEKRIIDFLQKVYKSFDAIILSDYGYGFFTEHVIQTISQLQKKYRKILVVDSKNLRRFSSIDITAIKPNYQQTIELLDIKAEQKNRLQQILKHGETIFTFIPTKIAALTVDVEGSVIFERGKRPFTTTTKPMPNTNAAGAGDTFVAALTLALAAKAPTKEAAAIASKAAEIVVQSTGTSTCTLQELQQSFINKEKVVKDLENIKLLVDTYRAEGKRIVFTNGCFDLLHKGHIDFLHEAKLEGDILIVGVNSDESVKKILGNYPLQQLSDRIEVLQELPMIDHIIPFDEEMPISLLQSIKPDVVVKGGTYKDKSIPEEEVIKSYRGSIKVLRFHSRRRISTFGVPVPHFIHSLLL